PKHPDGMSLGSEAVLALRNFARRNGTTVPIVILAAFAVVLSRWSELDDIVITLIHFARLHPQTWSLIGCFMQAWVLRAELYGQMSFDDVVRQIHRTTVEAQPHIQIPFFMTKQLLARASEEKPLLHVTFNYIPAHQFMQQASWTRDLSATVFPMQTEVPGALDEARGEKLILNIFDEPNSIRAILRYSSSRFSRETIERFWEHFCGFFHRAIPDPAEAARPLRRVPLSSSRAE
ncbi:MAG: condensation domain-containing protein, partial [Steroidobacteraceae bacterium]